MTGTMYLCVSESVCMFVCVYVFVCVRENVNRQVSMRGACVCMGSTVIWTPVHNTSGCEI